MAASVRLSLRLLVAIFDVHEVGLQQVTNATLYPSNSQTFIVQSLRFLCNNPISVVC